jgi:hypothetical protein
MATAFDPHINILHYITNAPWYRRMMLIITLADTST